MATVTANGITLEYETWGDPAAPPILLIMGLGMQLTSWPDAFREGLVAHGFRVLAFDNRDCGLSTRIRVRKTPNLLLQIARAWARMPVRSPYTLDDMAADTVGLLDALHVARAHVVGVSMGGMIAQVIAARYPERTASLTSIMSTTGNRRVSKSKPDARRALLSRPDDPDNPESVTRHLIELFGVIGSPGYPADHGELRARIERSVRRSYYPAGTAHQLLAILASGDRRRLLPKITAPKTRWCPSRRGATPRTTSRARTSRSSKAWGTTCRSRCSRCWSRPSPRTAGWRTVPRRPPRWRRLPARPDASVASVDTPFTIH